MATMREPFEGVKNILSFNRHFYVGALLAAVALITCIFLFPSMKLYFLIALILTAVPVFISLLVSWWIYDQSGLYDFHWLPAIKNVKQIATITAGFDETTGLISSKFPTAEIRAFDFYNGEKHTELSIERARKKGYVFPGTMRIGTANTSFPPSLFDLVFAVFSLHEIRDTNERISFFHEIKAGLAPNGKLIIVEHTRDVWNFIAYNIGFFHFLPAREWRKCFNAAGFSIEEKKRKTPFVTIYILSKNGNTH